MSSAGTGEYDLFGYVNRVQMHKDTVHPYPNNSNATVAISPRLGERLRSRCRCECCSTRWACKTLQRTSRRCTMEIRRGPPWMDRIAATANLGDHPKPANCDLVKPRQLRAETLTAPRTGDDLLHLRGTCPPPGGLQPPDPLCRRSRRANCRAACSPLRPKMVHFSPAEVGHFSGAPKGTGSDAPKGYTGELPVRRRGEILRPRRAPPPRIPTELNGRGRVGPSPASARSAPRTDPSVQNYRTGLPPRVLALREGNNAPALEVGAESAYARAWMGSEGGSRAAAATCSRVCRGRCVLNAATLSGASRSHPPQWAEGPPPSSIRSDFTPAPARCPGGALNAPSRRSDSCLHLGAGHAQKLRHPGRGRSRSHGRGSRERRCLCIPREELDANQTPLVRP